MENNPPSYTPGDSGKGAQYPPTQGPYPNQQAYPPTQPGYPPTQAGYPPTQPGYPPNQQGYPPTVYQNQNLGQSINQVGQSVTQAVNQAVVVRSGACPKCGIGSVNKEMTCCGIVLAVLFFPVGIICCIVMMEPKCNNCHATF